jgi:hypothetical protein
MMLRASVEHTGATADLSGINGGSDSGLPHGLLLVALADAAVDGNPDRLAAARSQLVEATSYEFMVDAAAVIANFEMMTRVADTTGAAISEAVEQVTAVDRGFLVTDTFESARWG